MYKLNADWEFQWMDTLDLPYEISLFKLAQFEYGYLIGAGKIHLAPEDDDIFMCKIALPEAIGIQEPAGNDQVNLYPNPVTNTLTIETALPGRIAYSIYDVTGQIMQTGNLLQKKEIDMGAFADGVYVIQLQTEFGEVRKKFVKQ